ncbi:hypothetical protein CC80DRAFT_597243 [Byssothecium circinans]|uniref:Extracellular membrane protein CFEM domain-containing protein n=1 Tax=Byssothecium circinans TaxID=147558 RepID=A0A6A5TIF2_9PLEO|nr:hypothetical protein CC80DRAFT_597243 [Byssothecium circinans]
MHFLNLTISLTILANLTFALAAGGGGGGGGGSSGGGSSSSGGGGSKGGGGSSSGGGGGSKGGGGSSSSGGGGSKSGGGGSKGGGSKPGGGSGGRLRSGSDDADSLDPEDPGAPGSGPDPYEYIPRREGFLPDQAQIQDVLGSMEIGLNRTITATTTGTNATSVVVEVSKIVEAVLVTPTCSPEGTGRWNVPSGVSKSCSPATVSFTPTTTLPATAFAACTDYASILRSCASATSSFYSLPGSQQASCICYTPTITTQSCIPTTGSTGYFYPLGTQQVAIPARSTAIFDNAAGACRDFFSMQGYSKLAGALNGKDGRNGTKIGAGFCANVNKDLKRAVEATATATATPTLGFISNSGLPYMLNPTPVEGCLLMDTSASTGRNGGSRATPLVTGDSRHLFGVVFFALIVWPTLLAI